MTPATIRSAAGNDSVVYYMEVGTTFKGGRGDEFVDCQYGGTYNGGDGTDTLGVANDGATTKSVEVLRGYCANPR